MLALAIDTSCDETSAAVTCGLEVWSNVIASQVELHRPYGGVFPTVAKQAHKENIRPTVNLALKHAGVTWKDIDAIAVTIGPGLAPALEVGVQYARKLSQEYKIPLRPINHMEGHILSVLALPQKKQPRKSLASRRRQARQRSQLKLGQLQLPALAILVSGGHTEFVLVEANRVVSTSHSPLQTSHSQLLTPNSQLRTPNSPLPISRSTNIDRQPRLSIEDFNSSAFKYAKLGQTLDDAAGEALDKIGRMLGLGYPAGPVIEEFAKRGNPKKYSIPLPMTRSQNYDLSFSGIKTHTRNLIEQNWGNQPLSKQVIYDLAASVQYGIFRHIIYKLSKILRDYPQIQEIWLGGGVAANITLRKMLRQLLREVNKQRKNYLKSTTPNLNRQSPHSQIPTLPAGRAGLPAGRAGRSQLSAPNPAYRQAGPNFQLPTPNSQLRTPYCKQLCGDNAAMIGIGTNLK